MEFYIANTSRHESAFNCRIPEITRPITQTLRIGSQTRVSGKSDLNKIQIDAIVRTAEIYGAKRVGHYDGVEGQVIPWLYDIDREISRKEIFKVMKHNEGQLTLIGKKAREEAAIAVTQAMETAVEPLRVNLNEMEMTIQQETEPLNGMEQVAEGIRVIDDAKLAERESREKREHRKRRGRR